MIRYGKKELTGPEAGKHSQTQNAEGNISARITERIRTRFFSHGSASAAAEVAQAIPELAESGGEQRAEQLLDHEVLRQVQDKLQLQSDYLATLMTAGRLESVFHSVKAPQRRMLDAFEGEFAPKEAAQ